MGDGLAGLRLKPGLAEGRPGPGSATGQQLAAGRRGSKRDSGLDGLLVLDKPSGITSARALDKVRRFLGQRKSGHAGTLDPMATGVLLVTLGRCTRLTERLMNLPKTYTSTVRLDATSASFDADRLLVPVAVDNLPTRERIDELLLALRGVIQQTPPAVSALKIRGRAAYARERAGETVELVPRSVRIDEVRATRYVWPELDIELACGRGFYVRALARDLGIALGTGGCLTRLRRTSVGPFHADDGWSLEKLAGSENAIACVIAPDVIERRLSESGV